MKALRNVAIIALIALAVTVLPGGTAATEAVLTLITLGFLAALAWFAIRLYRDQHLLLDSLSDGRRLLLYGALGAIALLVAGFSRFADSGGVGVLAWIVILCAAIATIAFVVRAASRYS